ncbi:Peptidase inhibitor I9 [Streptomyces sp. PpalLS-921]|nr:Peptidase inhibitor I9 [Streptomyces sp. PpalLS-921]
MRPRARWTPAALLLLAPLLGAAPAAADTGEALVPVQRSSRAVPGEYIVTVSRDHTPEAAARRLGVTPLFTYRTVLHGFAAELTPAQLEKVRGATGVQAVEENSEASVSPPAVQPAPTARVAAASWGLDRIDQRTLPLDGAYEAAGTGQGVTAYILDTGVESAHSEFAGRVGAGYDAIGDGRDGEDCNGHGTHVAGTVAGVTYGVAPSASVVPVRVLDCEGSGSWAGVIAGLDWIADHARQPAVVNASLGGPASPAVDDAFDALEEKGVLPVVAAGNESQDACDVSPAGPGARSPWGPPTPRTGRRRSATGARACPCTRPAPRSSPPSSAAAPPRSTAPPWPARTSPGPWPSTRRPTRPRRRRRSRTGSWTAPRRTR